MGVRRGAGIEIELASRTDQRVLRWLGHVEKMDGCRMARRVLMTRPRSGWMNGVKMAFGSRGMTVEAA